ncbi:MAG: Site-specific methylase, partial [Akkermansiaceae bacterium]|nr:Site-specific methylase [Akkermansiaceae bacterium]
MNYLSICSGICAATVAWQAPLGWRCLGFSEIEPFPCAVLAHHWPHIPNLGSLLEFMTWPEDLLARVDVLVGGTPCQAFSVAGLRQSLADARGNLTLIYVQLIARIDALRARHGRPPVICVWENVPGVLSTGDNAFGCFLAALAGECVPLQPPGGKWSHAGYVRGPLRAIAWRSLDAQYFGVPQRRQRVFAVASARDGFRPEAVLFEFEGLRRDSPPRREAGQIIAGTLTKSSLDGSSPCGGDGKDGLLVADTAPTLSTSAQGGGGLGTDFDLDGGLVASTGEISHCLNAGGMGRIDYETETETETLIAHSLKGEGFDGSEDGSEDGTGRGIPLV